MTGEEFRSKYNLLKRVTQQGVITFHAVTSTGRFVMVHVMPSGTRETRRKLLSVLQRLGPSDRQKILEVVDVEGSTVVVTELLEAFESFVPWLKARVQPRAGKGPKAKPAAPAPPKPSERAPRSPAQPASRTAKPSPAQPPAAPPVAPPEVEPQPASGTPGPGDAPGVEAGIAASGQPQPPSSLDDEFTQLFGPPLDSPPEAEAASASPAPPAGDAPAPPAAAASSPPGEFTGLFGALNKPTREEPPAQQPEPDAQPEPPPRRRPGEFTQLFGARDVPEDDAPGSPPPRPGAQAPHVPPTPASPAPPPPPLAPKHAPGAQGWPPQAGQPGAGPDPDAAAPQAPSTPPRGKPVVRWKGSGSRPQPPRRPVVPPQPPPVQPVQPPPPPVAPPPSQPSGPGEFSLLFGKGRESPPAPGSSPRASRGAGRAKPVERDTEEYLRALGSGSVPIEEMKQASGPPPPPEAPPQEAPPSVAPPVPAPPTSPPPAAAGPSEFTLVVSGGQQRPPATSAPLPPSYPEADDAGPADVPEGRRGLSHERKVMWFGLGVLGIAAAILVIVFLLT